MTNGQQEGSLMTSSTDAEVINSTEQKVGQKEWVFPNRNVFVSDVKKAGKYSPWDKISKFVVVNKGSMFRPVHKLAPFKNLI